MDTSLPRPAAGRAHAATRQARLSDLDAAGRVRLDALARFLQDVAIEDVQETGWGIPRHLWFVRRIRVDVATPFRHDREVRLETWCSGVAALAAGRRWSLRGDRGGAAEVDSVWIHLDPDGRPERIGEFGPYAEAAGGRSVSTRLELPGPPPGAGRSPWPLRASDVDLHGHVNNAVHWQAVEHALHLGGVDASVPLRAELEYRDPVDLGDDVELATARDGAALAVWLLAGSEPRAAARVAPLPGAAPTS